MIRLPLWARRSLAILFAAWLSACATHPSPSLEKAKLAAAAPTPNPQIATAPEGAAMVVAADVRAAEAGRLMLREGGSAADAAIAAMLVLGLVEPQSAGIGGGAYVLTYDAETQKLDSIDGREAAPRNVDESLFLGPDGKQEPFLQSIASGRSIGTPGLISALKLLHEGQGKLPWARLFEPAIALAENGFAVSPRMHRAIALIAKFGQVQLDPAAKAYLFGADGQPAPIGAVLKNPAYAASLRLIAAKGPVAIRSGPIADAIVKAAQGGVRPGTLDLTDLSFYRAKRRAPICGPFRVYRVCGMRSSSSGGVTVLQILNLYERMRPETAGGVSASAEPENWAAFLWASRLAYADRDYYLADEDFVSVPIRGLINADYLDDRVKQVDLTKAPPALIEPGDPAAFVGGYDLIDRWGRPLPGDEAGTTHLSVIDAEGDAVSMTASIESVFGAQRMAAGFFLNNELTDFARAGSLHDKPLANAPEGGKRPRSSMSPTIVLGADGKVEALIGSPGGSGIIAYVAKTLIGTLDWKLSMPAAVALPNMVASNAKPRGDVDRLPPSVTAALTARGWDLAPLSGEESGLNGILRTPEGWQGAADPRREGVALAGP